MTAPGAGTPAATSPGRAAYEAFDAHLGPIDDPGYVGPNTIPLTPWEDVRSPEREAWEAAAQAAIKAVQVADDADMRDEMDQLRDLYDDLREHIDSLALGMEMSARTTAPSRKSEIEAGCASALRGLLRTDGESDEDTRQRLGRERDSLAGRVDGLVSKAGELREERDRLADALAGNPDPLVSALQSQVEHFRELIAEILDALDHGGPYWAEEWRARAGLEG